MSSSSSWYKKQEGDSKQLKEILVYIANILSLSSHSIPSWGSQDSFPEDALLIWTSEEFMGDSNSNYSVSVDVDLCSPFGKVDCIFWVFACLCGLGGIVG